MFALALALAIIPRGWELKLKAKVETLVGYYLGRAAYKRNILLPTLWRRLRWALDEVRRLFKQPRKTPLSCLTRQV